MTTGYETVGIIYARKDFGGYGEVTLEFTHIIFNKYKIVATSLERLKPFEANIFVLDLEGMEKHRASLCIEKCLEGIYSGAPLLVSRPEKDLEEMEEKFHFVTIDKNVLKKEGVTELFKKAFEITGNRPKDSI